MNWLRLVRARLFGLLHKRELEEGIDEELRFHVAMRTQDNIARGMSPNEAKCAASRQFGNPLSIKDACRDVSGGGGLEILWQDMRFAARMLARDRGFTAVAVLALALGIGANTALFTVMSNVLLRPLPYPDSSHIMSVWTREAEPQPNDRMALSYPDFQDLAARNRSFDGMGGFQSGSFVVAAPHGYVAVKQGAMITSGLFRVLGVVPSLGRSFLPIEDQPGNRSVVISYEFWQEAFGGTPDIIGARIVAEGEQHVVIGVMPAGFHFPIQNDPAQFWFTFARMREAPAEGGPAAAMRRDAHFVNAVGRLKAKTTASIAETDLSEIAADLAARYPQTNARLQSCAVVPLLADLTKAVRPALILLVGAALCVLCVACVNVANLLLARASTRMKEIAIRSALGAGRRRILRQLLTESLLLATLGGSVGLVLAVWGTRYIVSVLPPNFPRLVEIVPDLRVLSFACLVTLATSCFFGFAPAWRSSHCDLASLLNDCSRGSSETRRGRRARSLLVVTEMVLAFVLLAGACCLIRGLWKLENAEPGFNPHGLLTASVSGPNSQSAEAPARSAAFHEEFLRRVSSLGKVQSASEVYPLPFTLQTTLADFEIMGRSTPKAEWPRARAHTVTPNYFRTMEIPLLRGRDFDARDQREAQPVVIINETLAREHFGNEDPLGKKIRPGLTDSLSPVEREIIGVVGDVKSAGLGAEQKAEVYLPHPQCAASDMALVVRTALSTEQLLAALRSILEETEGQPPVYKVSAMEDYLAADIAQPRLSSKLLGAFALVAVLLTAIGVYGVTAYSAAQRRHEIGIRLALGAQKIAVFRLVIAEGVRLVVWSVIGGSLLTLGMAPLLPGFANGSSGHEGSILLFVTLLLSSVGLMACCLPAHRAAADDPLAAIGQR